MQDEMSMMSILTKYWIAIATWLVSLGAMWAKITARVSAVEKQSDSIKNTIKVNDSATAQAIKEINERIERERDRQEGRDNLRDSKIDGIKDLVGQVLINTSKQ